MPFTSAHIAAIIPFKKLCPKYLSITALAIGSMVPDFEYFIRMTLYGHYGHTIKGIFIFDIPMGIALYLIFHGIIRKTLIQHLPPFAFIRLGSAQNFNWKGYVSKQSPTILLSLFVGVLTHFIWDGFTHDKEYFVANYLTILNTVITIGGTTMPLHFFLQLFSTLLGTLLCIWYFINIIPKNIQQVTPTKQIITYWVSVFVLTIVIGCIRWAFGMPDEKLIGQLVVVSVSSFLLSLIIISWFFRETTATL
jgi:hypothetical protein